MCLWTQSVARFGTSYAHRVLPDGCIDVVFMNDEPPVVVGPYVESFIAHLPPGTSIIGARFRPGCAASLLGHPASALLNQSVALDALWKRAACTDFVSLVHESSGVAAKLVALEAALLSRIPQAKPVDREVAVGIKWLANHPEGRVEELSGWIGMSSRQFRRRFSAAVGYCPKIFQEVLRFQYLLNLAAAARHQARFADLSAEAGYADQAHMTRQVHRFSDVPPTDLFDSARCTLQLSGLIHSARSDYGFCQPPPRAR
ncbi:MAG: helix-turn-helix transcriptional regulator [Acidobacteriaceae bacterium]|nr:helix-turn-helix transcriptional regulator [Acidobacteriaceae bacterium]